MKCKNIMTIRRLLNGYLPHKWFPLHNEFNRSTSFAWICVHVNSLWTRKSSCVNARGIPTTAYQVLHVLSCTSGGTPVGVTLCRHPLGGVPPSWPGPGGTLGGCPLSGVPHCPDLAGGYPGQALPWLGYPTSWPDWGYPRQVPPWLGYPPSWPAGTPWLRYPPSWPGRLDLARVPPSWTWLGYPPGWTWLGYPHPAGVDWQTKWNYNLPSHSTYSVGKNSTAGVVGRTTTFYGLLI